VVDLFDFGAELSLKPFAEFAFRVLQCRDLVRTSSRSVRRLACEVGESADFAGGLGWRACVFIALVITCLSSALGSRVKQSAWPARFAPYGPDLTTNRQESVSEAANERILGG
jgi:hypothetical protein